LRVIGADAGEGEVIPCADGEASCERFCTPLVVVMALLLKVSSPTTLNVNSFFIGLALSSARA
jgi:hypothetical protein